MECAKCTALIAALRKEIGRQADELLKVKRERDRLETQVNRFVELLEEGNDENSQTVG